MPNREASLLLGVAVAILEDVTAFYPEDTEWFGRDKTRLSHLVQTRGLGVFLLDLPNIGKWLERALDTGRLEPSHLPLSRGKWRGSPIPRLFSGLWLRVFDNTGSLREQADVTAIMFLRQICYFAKGYKHDCSESRWLNAVEDFYICEDEIPNPDLFWSGDDIGIDRIRDLHLYSAVDTKALNELDVDSAEGISSVRCRSDFLQSCFDYVATRWIEFDPTAYAPRHGPGAVADLPGGVSKYSFPSWPAKLERIFPYADFGVVNYGLIPSDHQTVVEQASALLGVPKTAKGPRLIASEPTSHQWCQQIVAGYLSGVIASTPLRHSIALRDQTLSRDRVLEASHSQDAATIDLSAASDRLSCKLIERFFRTRGDLIEVFHSVRTRTIDNRTGRGRTSRHVLRKFSTMGSALTFPMQSIVFATIAVATLLYEEGRNPREILDPAHWRRIRVFGDDIICPRHVFSSVKISLTMLGLRVNSDKSFGNGKFLESCGMDAYDGVCVTPAKLNRLYNAASPESTRSVLDASNNFFLKGFWRTAEYLKSTLPHWVQKNLDVVSVDSGLVGLVSYCGSSVVVGKTRYNARLQRHERRTLDLRSTVHKSSQPGEHTLLQWFIEKPRPESIWVAGRVKSVSQYLALGWAPLGLLTSQWVPRGSCS